MPRSSLDLCRRLCGGELRGEHVLLAPLAGYSGLCGWIFAPERRQFLPVENGWYWAESIGDRAGSIARDVVSLDS